MMLSGEPSGDLMRRSSSRAASSPISRAPMATVVKAGRCIAPSGILSKPITATSRPGVKAEVRETQHDAERAEVVVAQHRGRGVGFVLEELAGRGGPALSRRQAIDDRPDRQSESRQDGAEGLGSVARGRHAPRAADKGDALMP